MFLFNALTGQHRRRQSAIIFGAPPLALSFTPARSSVIQPLCQVAGSFDIDLKCDSMVRYKGVLCCIWITHFHIAFRRIASASAFGSSSRSKDKEPSFSFPQPLMQDMQFGGLMMHPHEDRHRFRFARERSSAESCSDDASASLDGDDDDGDDDDGDDEMQLELYIQMEYCQNTLREIISSSSSSSSSNSSSGGSSNDHTKKLQIMRQITEALEYLHASGASARPITTTNLF